MLLCNNANVKIIIIRLNKTINKQLIITTTTTSVYSYEIILALFVFI